MDDNAFKTEGQSLQIAFSKLGMVPPGCVLSAGTVPLGCILSGGTVAFYPTGQSHCLTSPNFFSIFVDEYRNELIKEDDFFGESTNYESNNSRII